jgi:hypothetical protein
MEGEGSILRTKISEAVLGSQHRRQTALFLDDGGEEHLLAELFHQPQTGEYLVFVL